MAGERPQNLTIASILVILLAVTSIIIGVSTLIGSPIIVVHNESKLFADILTNYWPNLSGVLLFIGGYGMLVGSYWMWYLIAFVGVFDIFAGIEYILSSMPETGLLVPTFVFGVAMIAISVYALYVITRDNVKDYFL